MGLRLFVFFAKARHYGQARSGPSVMRTATADLKITRPAAEKNSFQFSSIQSRSAWRSHSAKVAHSQRSMAPGRQQMK